MGTAFNLDNRLALCASFVRKDTKLVDVGTDHAYLPIWLVCSGVINTAVACDVRSGPLENAKNNIEFYHVQQKIKTVLSDGLDNIAPEDAYDIVMAGMGGELIAEIIKRQQWLCDGKRRLILQPMTRAESLRLFLCENGFDIIKEKACVSGKKTYSVMLCEYDGILRQCDKLFQYVGMLIDDYSDDARKYISAVNFKLKKKIRAYEKNSREYEELKIIIEKLNNCTKE